MIKLEPFTQADFDTLISWVDSKELLVTIAGTLLSYPLTAAQLRAYLDDEKSHSFTIMDPSQNRAIGHAELCLTGDDMWKIDKLLIGDKTHRGKGLGLQTINALLAYAFVNLGAKIVELNVYDWNTAGIRCYEKAGFVFTPGKIFSTRFDDKAWRAMNMTIDREKWSSQKQSPPESALGA